LDAGGERAGAGVLRARRMARGRRGARPGVPLARRHVLHQGRAVRGGVRPMTTPALSVSRATAQDAGTIADLHVRSWRFAYADFLPADYLAGLDVVGHALRYWQPALAKERRNSSTHVASVDGVPAGF